MIKSVWLYVVVVAAVLWAGVAQQPPPPAPVSAPATVFSAERAMADVRAIAVRPHPIGSDEIGRVRTYLLERLAQLGLGGETHTGQGSFQLHRGGSSLAAGSVQNLIGVLPGRDRTRPALLIMSHYDSVPNSPGAADDTAGVAASLEIARMLRAGPQPERDVIFLFTDGEEAGLLGADAFFDTDPMARRVGVVINMETRGAAGRATMFETGPGSGGLVRLMGATLGTPSAMSLSSAIYHLLPNNTDFTLAERHGLPGLNFAFLDDLPAYHTPLSTPERLDRGSLQDLGNQAGGVARAIAQRVDLPRGDDGDAYVDGLGLVFLHYPGWAGWGLLALAFGAAVLATVRARRAGRTTPMQVLRGLALFISIGSMTGLVLLLIGAGLGLGDYYGDFRVISHGRALVAGELCAALVVMVAMSGAAAAGRGGIVVAGIATLLALGVCGLRQTLDPLSLGLAAAAAGLGHVALSRPITAWSAWIAALLAGLVVAAGLQAVSPAMAPTFLVPLLVASVAALTCSLTGDAARGRGLAVAAVLMVPGLALAFYAGYQLFVAIGSGMPLANLVVWLMAAPLLAPLAHAAGRVLLGWILALACALAAVAALVLAAAPASARHPQAAEAFYLADPGMKLWAWCSRLPRTDWSDAVLRSDGGRIERTTAPPLLSAPARIAKARRVDVPSPMVGGMRIDTRLLLRAAPARRGQTLVLMLRPDVALKHARLNGVDVPLDAHAGAWTTVSFEAPPPEGVTLAFDTPEHGKVEFAAAEIAPGWPDGSHVPPSPPGVMGLLRTGTTVAVARLIAAW